MTPEEKIEAKAAVKLMVDHSFYGILLSNLRMCPDTWCRTAMTNGERLVYNPKYIESLPFSQTVGLLAHEVCHCALGHFWRGEGKDHDLWNQACDYKINQGLVESKFELPSGALIDARYNNLAEEEIYQILLKQQKQKGGGQGSEGTEGGNDPQNQQNQGPNGENGSDPGKCGGVMQVSGQMGKEKQEQMKSEWKSIVSNAVHACKGQGSIPADILRAVKEVLDPPLPWYVLLRDFVERSARNDYNWNRPNRRYFSQNIILPGLVSEELPTVIIAVDTSGSTQEYLDRFASEVSAVLSAYKTQIIVIYCDAMVHKVEEWSSDDLPLKLEMVGGGGTSFRPVFEYVEKEGLIGSCMLFFTDLYGSFPSKEPEYPVMWITPNDQIAPFGITVKFHMDA